MGHYVLVMGKVRCHLTSTEAAEVAELAVVLPILFTLIFAIFSFGRAYNVYSTVTRAAQEGARVAVTPACATCTSFTSTGCSASQYPCPSSVAQAVIDALNASNVDPSHILPSTTTYTFCPSPIPSGRSQTNNITIWQGVVLNPTSSTAAQACGTIVQFDYDYQFLPIPFVPAISRRITARGQTWLEY